MSHAFLHGSDTLQPVQDAHQKAFELGAQQKSAPSELELELQVQQDTGTAAVSCHCAARVLTQRTCVQKYLSSTRGSLEGYSNQPVPRPEDD